MRLLLFLTLVAFVTSRSDWTTATADLPICQLSLLLEDAWGDGWNKNSLRLLSGPDGIPSYPVPLTPDTPLCTVDDDFLGTLIDTKSCSFTFSMPSGWSLGFDYQWNIKYWPFENSWTVQLKTGNPVFGPVVISKSNNVTAQMRTKTTWIPQSPDVLQVLCGPLPPKVSGVTVAAVPKSALTSIQWSPVIVVPSSGNPNPPPVVYNVFARDTSISVDDQSHAVQNLGTTSSNTLIAFLWEETTYEISVIALNKFGSSAPTYASYRTPDYPTCEILLVLQSSTRNGWSNGAYVDVSVNNLRTQRATFPCATADTCTRLELDVALPADGTSYMIRLGYVSSSGGAGNSFQAFDLNGKMLFDSGSTPSGPQFTTGVFNVSCQAPTKVCGACCLGAGQCDGISPDGYCCQSLGQCCKTGSKPGVGPYTCCSGANKCLTNFNKTIGKQCAVPPASCPVSAPTEGDNCYGQMTCKYEPKCCCPDELPENQVCQPTKQYYCSGVDDATWTATTISLPCDTDPNFACPSQCPRLEPTSSNLCLAAKSCNYKKVCCCPDEVEEQNKLCSYTSIWSCTGTLGGRWSQTISTPPSCPDICPSQTRPGQCPVPPAGLLCPLTFDNCTSDSNCDRLSKCCDGFCGKRCKPICDCTTNPTCLPWEKVFINATAGGCCGGVKYCATDPTSTECLPTVADWATVPCVLPSGTCGVGRKTRTVNTRTPTGCVVTTETQACTVPCPVDCVGAWGPCGACSSTCLGGTCTRTYLVSTPASNGGNDCSIGNGTTSLPEPCPNLPACRFDCPLAVDARDSYGDGWEKARVRIIIPGQPNVTAGVIGSFKQQFTPFSAPNGSIISVQWTRNGEGYPGENSFKIVIYQSGVAGAVLFENRNFSTVSVGTAPDPGLFNITIFCANCGSVNNSRCSSVSHRSGCRPDVIPASCGPCLSGWTSNQTYSNNVCQDIDECANIDNVCVGAGASCVNTPGSFYCSCPNGTQWHYGQCERPGSCPSIRMRMEWFDLTNKEKNQYVRAIQLLDDNGKWPYFYNKHANGNTQGGNFHYAHGHAGFPYWHRLYLLEFENTVRSLAVANNIDDLKCFTLAYFDWSATVLSPTVEQDLKTNFFTNAKDKDGFFIGLGEKSSSCANTIVGHPFSTLKNTPGCFRRTAWSPPNWEAPQVLWSRLNAKTWEDLCNGIEGSHGALHVWTGGQMASTVSPADPLFFLHHSFVDFLIATWQSCNGLYTWSGATSAQRWYAKDGYQESDVMPGFTQTPDTMWSLENIGVMYSSTSVARATAGNYYNCPVNMQRWLRAPKINAPAPASFIEMNPLDKKAKIEELRSIYNARVEGWTRSLNPSAFIMEDDNVTTSNDTLPAPATSPLEVSRTATTTNSEIQDMIKSAIESGVSEVQALSDALLEQCKLAPPTSVLLLDDNWIQMMNLQDICSKGFCVHQCHYYFQYKYGKTEEAELPIASTPAPFEFPQTTEDPLEVPLKQSQQGILAPF